MAILAVFPSSKSGVGVSTEEIEEPGIRAVASRSRGPFPLAVKV